MQNYKIVFVIESMICALGAIIMKNLPKYLLLWLILDRHSCFMLITCAVFVY